MKTIEQLDAEFNLKLNQALETFKQISENNRAAMNRVIQNVLNRNDADANPEIDKPTQSSSFMQMFDEELELGDAGGPSGSYAGPFSVSRASADSDTLNITGGKILIYTIQPAGEAGTEGLTLAYQEVSAGSVVVTGAGSVCLKIYPVLSGNWPADAGKITPCSDTVITLTTELVFIESAADMCAQMSGTWVVPLATVSAAGVISQEQYGNFKTFMPPWMAMYYCEMGIEKCMKNFGVQVSCSSVGGGPT